MKKQVNLAKKFIDLFVVLAVFCGILAPFSGLMAASALVISNVSVVPANNSVTISWQTDRPAFGRVNYGLASNSYGWTVQTNPDQKYASQTITILGLNPNTQYFFRINVRDEGSEVTSLERSFTTLLANQATTNTNSSLVLQNPVVQTGNSTQCGVNLSTDLGFTGYYYNLPSTHPDMEKGVGSWTKVARQNDWYDQKYFAFNRVDKNLNFGSNFFPVSSNLAGDPQHFAVNWRGIIEVSQTDTYNYKITSDDDSWVFIDDVLSSDLNGVHMAKTDTKNIQLTAGLHKIEIYYADRMKYGAVMSFTADTRLKFHPLPLNCGVQDVIDYNNQLNNGNMYGYTGNNNQYTNPYDTSNAGNATGGYVYNGSTAATGQVLGASNINDSVYVNGWDGKYSQFKAIYRTNENPDIWAITMTNQRFYITSPASFNKYGLDWKKIKTVSRATLNRYPIANLVKTPDDNTVYFLHQRDVKKWLRLPFTSGTVFVSYANNYWGNIVRINELDMSSYAMVNLIKVKGKATVYEISGNTKRPFATGAAFLKLNYNWADICEVNQIHADSYITGSAIR